VSQNYFPSVVKQVWDLLGEPPSIQPDNWDYAAKRIAELGLTPAEMLLGFTLITSYSPILREGCIKGLDHLKTWVNGMSEAYERLKLVPKGR